MTISVVFASGPQAAVQLAEELYAMASVHPPGCDHEQEHEEPVMRAIARRDGVLLGWAEVIDLGGDDKVATVNAAYAPREVERIAAGYYKLGDPPPGQEAEVLGHLIANVAVHARAAGYAKVEWFGPDVGAAGRVAERLNARAAEELARCWSITDLATWHAPVGLPSAVVRHVPQPLDEDALPSLLVLNLLGAGEETIAQISAVVEGRGAHVGRVVTDRGVEVEQLAAFVAEFVDQLRQLHPEVTELVIQEVGDELVWLALDLSGLQVTTRYLVYQLSL